MGVLRLAHGPPFGSGRDFTGDAGSTLFCFPSRPLRLLWEAFFEPRHVFGFSGRDYPCDVRFLCIFLVVARALVHFFGVLLLKFSIVRFFFAFLSFVWGFPLAFPGGFTVGYITGGCLR